MKILNWVAGLGLAFSPLLAQEARAPIESDWAEMDLKAGVYHYSGNVRVDVPGSASSPPAAPPAAPAPPRPPSSP